VSGGEGSRRAFERGRAIHRARRRFVPMQPATVETREVGEGRGTEPAFAGRRGGRGRGILRRRAFRARRPRAGPPRGDSGDRSLIALVGREKVEVCQGRGEISIQLRGRLMTASRQRLRRRGEPEHHEREDRAGDEGHRTSRGRLSHGWPGVDRSDKTWEAKHSHDRDTRSDPPLTSKTWKRNGGQKLGTSEPPMFRGLSHSVFLSVDSLCASSLGSDWSSVQKSNVGNSRPNAW
jgi:hypothetical protein